MAVGFSGISLSSLTDPNTTQWSPPSWTVATSQSMCASDPSMIGDPRPDGCQSIPANLSGSREPNRAETSRWSSASTFTQNLPDASIAAQDRDCFVGQNSTSGGSNESAANDWHANPTGSPSCVVVMMVTPVQNCPSR